MIPLTEWSRRRPSQPIFPVFDGIGLEADEIGSLEFDGLLNDLIVNVQISAACQVQAAFDAQCAHAKQQVAADIDAKAEALANRISLELTHHFNAVLKPWMGKQIKETAVESFCQAVGRAVGDELSQEISVQAPQAFQDKVMELLGAESIKANISGSADAELHARIGATTIMTEISVWQDKLNSILP